MPLQKSFSEQHSRSRYHHRNQWQQRSHSYAPRPQYPPPLPPPRRPPPVEISKKTKSKFKQFQFRAPLSDRGDGNNNSNSNSNVDDSSSHANNSFDELFPRGQGSSTGDAVARDEAMAAPVARVDVGSEVAENGQDRRKRERRDVDAEATAAETTTTTTKNHADKENDALPSTQPNKVTPPVSATPEFLSIHVGTPRARFAWQELAGTPDTPKVKESLGISPDAQLSWMTENVQTLLPVAPKQGTKRARSSSPPSSPSSSKSKRAALNVQKFREAVKTALANPALPPPRNRLARHHTALERTPARAAASEMQEPTAQDTLSPRSASTLRRASSCGNPLPAKRQKGSASAHGQQHNAQDDNPLGTAVPLGPRDLNSMATESRVRQRSQQARRSPTASRPPSRQRQSFVVESPSQPKAQAHAGAHACAPPTVSTWNRRPTDQFGEGQPGDQEEGGASLKVDEAAKSLPVGSMKGDSFSDYGDDLFDDDILAELDASLVPEHEPTTAVTRKASQEVRGARREDVQHHFDELDDLDDDIFTADVMAEIDAERQPTTTDAAQTNHPTTTKLTPTVDPVGGVDDMEDVFGDDFGADFDYDAAEQAATQAAGRSAAPWANIPSVLVVQGERNSLVRTIRLRGDWVDTPASVKAFVHVLGDFDAAGTCIVDNDRNMLILHPDQLVSSTVVADSFGCTRRAVLQDRVKATSDPSPALVYGTLLHEIFQDALMANRWDRAFLNGVVEKTMKKHLEDLYTIRVETGMAREHLLTKTKELQYWADMFISSQPKADAIVQGRNGQKVKMCVSKLLDVEEHVWSPMYGLKGNIDATVQVSMQQADGQECQTLTVPFELKTGRNASSSHQAQTVLYNLLLSDRYDIEIVYGILYYMENSQMLRIPAIRHELRHMIMKRNELACYIRERSVQLPPMLRSKNACGRCFAQTSCFIYHKLADDGDGDTSGMSDKFDEVVGHLTPTHKAFFLKWENLLTKEEKESHKLRRELWTMISAEREKLGRCFGNVLIEEGSAFESQDNPKINRFHYTFIKENPPANFSFMDSQLIVGEPIVVSDEQGHFALALGYVTAVRKQRIMVAVDRRLHNARIRQPGFDEKTNQVFTGIMEAAPAGHGSKRTTCNARGLKQEEKQEQQSVVRYRVDKDEFSNGMATVRNNLVQVMAGSKVGAREIRELVVDLVPPRFKTVLTQYVLDGATSESLNVDQKRAIEKVMSAQDYALVLGMPGTGKTTTIAHIIRALVRKGKSVLLTSYTHTAVDNILLKLKTSQVPILRLGAPAKIHPEVQEFAVLASEPKPSFEAIRHAWHNSPVVATTCLSISHPIFNERTFDYCIVDEASQITLPICLGPIRMARTFVLVGDHNQLPPLVQNEEARVGGLDVSLFKLLSDTHPDSVVSLEHQYRMCEDIMTLSNTLIYNGRLKCGTEALRLRSLHVPDLDRLRQHHHNADSVARLQPRSFCAGVAASASSSSGAPRCWLRDLLRPETRVAFVNTDALDGSREEAKGNRIVNPCEARLVAQLVEGLLTVGVPAGEIGVMTHYRSQLSLLKHQLRGIAGHVPHQAGPGIEMHTADRFQGRDKDVVVLSLVRNNEACSIGDLLKDWRRINVAFTRAKTKLLVVGSRSTLKGKNEREKGAGDDDDDRDVNNNNNNNNDNNSSSTTGEAMLARFVRLMEERAWIYDLPSDALESHLFEELPATQAASSLAGAVTAGATGGVRSPTAVRTPTAQDVKREPLSPLKARVANARVPLAGKENRQPLKTTRISQKALLKGKPILQDILNDMMGSKY
ncbi:DNA replication helicase [Niveomyces insectorum RCEF 264]|uniref:DNA replication ATP-dependent helicase/nuclease n=1 Tax=Niveomyces insectorum RCEF 264 TaxID=1081102 RepID=A0A167VHN8_9HYPO|nr:DNA replication helicase [Niveomyces insectorum RCEF 264]